MTRQELINKLKALIVEQTSPERIWLYGSEAAGESKPVSDIDIAFWADPSYSGEELKQQAEHWQTLLSFDLTNLALCDERFVERVRATGKVIYSNSKKLRAQDALHNFGKALNRLNEGYLFAKEHSEVKDSDELEHILLDVQIKRFEFTYEMCWKAIKRTLAYEGLEASSPRACFKEAFAQGWIKDQDIFLNMIEMRNNTAHTYDLELVREIKAEIPKYIDAFRAIDVKLQQQLDQQ